MTRSATNIILCRWLLFVSVSSSPTVALKARVNKNEEARAEKYPRSSKQTQNVVNRLQPKRSLDMMPLPAPATALEKRFANDKHTRPLSCCRRSKEVLAIRCETRRRIRFRQSGTYERRRLGFELTWTNCIEAKSRRCVLPHFGRGAACLPPCIPVDCIPRVLLALCRDDNDDDDGRSDARGLTIL